MTPFEFKIPQLTQRKVTDLPNGEWAACTVESGSAMWGRYANAYREAGNALVEATQESPYRRNILGAPILFCYRQYIELSLKGILKDAGELLDDPQVIPGNHYLLALWKKVRGQLEQIAANGDSPWILRSESIVEQFDGLDPNSFCFRYPVDKDSKPTLPEPLKFDPVLVREVIDELALLLDGAGAQISEYMGVKHDGY